MYKMKFEILLMTIAVRVAALPLPDFFPFGPNFGDQTLPTGNDESVKVALQQAFPFYGEARGFITVSSDSFFFFTLHFPGSSAMQAVLALVLMIEAME